MGKTMIKNLILIFSIIFISGCTNVTTSIYDYIDESKYARATDFKHIANSLVDDMYENLEIINNNKNNSPIIITDFVNMNYLENKSNLGFVLSSHLKTSLNDYFKDIQIKELTVGQDIKIGQNGVKILSRNLSNLAAKDGVETKYILVGKYAITAKKLICFLDLIDYTTGNVVDSSTETVTITKEILMLEGKRDGYDKRVIRTPFIL